MCQLLGVSHEKPTPWNGLFAEFRKRGASNPHAWGAAWWAGDGRGPAVVREARPAHESPLAAALAAAETPAVAAVAHVRYGTTPGEGSLKATANAHPFLYRIAGRDWAFAHNGWLRAVRPAPFRRPEGTTDSEEFFALLADALEAAAWKGVPPEETMAAEAARHARRGKLNFAASDGEALYFHASAPGTLWWRPARGRGSAALVVATQPLFTEKGWLPAEPGTVYVARRGRLARKVRAEAARRAEEARQAAAPGARRIGSLKVPGRRTLIDWLEEEVRQARIEFGKEAAGHGLGI